MNTPREILEQHVFISNRKNKEILRNVFEKIFTYPLAEILIEYTDSPDETYSNINDRAKKILLNLPKTDKIACISGQFLDGGSFKLVNGNLSIQVAEDEYNYELIQALKNFLSPTFPLWIFQNPYIWGVNIYEDYDRNSFFETRKFSARAKLLDKPEIDIFRRDSGVIHKYRFFLKDESLEGEEGIRYLVPYFQGMMDGLRKKNYEGLEILHTYCTDKSAFRRMETRTKLGKDIKSILDLH